MKFSVADYVIWRLAKHGTKCVFILPGGGCMYLIDSLAKQSQIEVIPLLHEQSVGIAAEAYSQFTGDVGVSIVTTGPGGTNAITACAAAWTDSTPMLFISGQVKTSDNGSKLGLRQMGFQEIPITRIVSPITKRSVLLERAEDAQSVLEELLVLAKSERPGPVWLDIPLDIQNKSFELKHENHVEVVASKLHAQVNDVQKLVSAIKQSFKPVFLIGNGVRLGGMIKEMEELLRLTNIPSLLTWKMIDFLDEEDPLNAGRPGAIAQPWSNYLQEEADLLICLGARIDTGQSSYNLLDFGKNATKYVVDVDSAELSKFPSGRKYVTLNYDLRTLLPELIKQLAEAGFQATSPVWVDWLKRLHDLKKKFQETLTSKSSNGNYVNLYKFVKELSNQLPSNAIIVPGSSGSCSEVVMQAFQVKKGQRIFNSEGLGPMGFGIPAALGACVASGKNKIICVDGDGGFLMNIQELASVKLHANRILFFVLNNNGYGSIKLTQDRLFEGRRLGTDPSTGLALVNIKEIARAFGFQYDILESEISLESDLRRVLSARLSSIIEVLVDPNQVTLPRVKSIRDKSGVPMPSNMEIMDF